MNIYWLEQTEPDVPAGDAWLSLREAGILRAMRFPKRRASWLLGRWTAKRALAACFGASAELQSLRDIEILPVPSGAPDVFLHNEPASVTISLSHRAGAGACAVVPSRVLLGCDLEMIEPHGESFITDYFTAEEQAFVAAAAEPDRLRLLALLWSAKESALKALREGLRLDTRSVIVSLPIPQKGPSNWSPLCVRSTDAQVFHGWWNQTGGLIRTVLAVPRPDPPLLLAQECSLIC